MIGFLKLLTNLKISDLAALSQTSSTGSYSSGHSLFTQISMSRASQSTPSTFSNEALCLEVLSILKRCFMQQAEVRVQLYAGKPFCNFIMFYLCKKRELLFNLRLLQRCLLKSRTRNSCIGNDLDALSRLLCY